MKRFPALLISALIALNGCSSGTNIKVEQPELIDVAIEQGGNTIEIIDDTAEIRRTEFSLIFNFNQPDSILVNASFLSETYNNARQGLPLSELSGFKNTGVADELFNKNSSIYISYNSPNFWYYTDDSDHRFSSIIKSENGYKCRRIISGLIDLDGTGDKTDIQKIRQSEIFLVIIKSEWNEDYTRLIEKNRKTIKLKFII